MVKENTLNTETNINRHANKKIIKIKLGNTTSIRK